MKINVLIACITVLLALAALEAVVRLGSEIDGKGNLIFRGYVLDRHATLVEKQRRNVEDYLEDQEQAMHIYDEWLGWTFRPNAARQEEFEFTINSAGIRSQREYSQTPPPDTLRIALFGDSFTAGAEVSDDEAWGHQLEMKLNQAGIRAEALNFGVGYYGMGQAFLRWRHQGQHYAPDMVIFGFQSGNLNRNVNIFSSIFFSHLPFSKPRFVLTESGGLELLNSPVMPLEQIADVFESFGSHPWVEHEYYYSPRWWSFSQLAAFLHVALTPRDSDYGPTSERGMVGKAIVDAFAAEVKARESAFFVMYLPPHRDLYNLHNGIPKPHQYLLDYFDEAYHYIAFEDQLDRSYLDYGWAPMRHYGPEISSIAAQAAADEIQSCIESGACELSRFEDKRAIFISE